jgi:hypothetical protein
MLWETTPYQLLNDKMTVYSMTKKKKKKKTLKIRHVSGCKMSAKNIITLLSWKI